MIGRRIESPFAHSGALVAEWPQAGDYWFNARIGWCACVPTGDMANLSAHTVTEHDDRTITVSPSILVGDSDHACLWHGFLERGVWRTV